MNLLHVYSLTFYEVFVTKIEYYKDLFFKYNNIGAH